MFIENIVVVICNVVFVSALGSAEVECVKFPLLNISSSTSSTHFSGLHLS